MEVKREKKHNPRKKTNHFRIRMTIGILFFMYGRYQDPELLTPSAIDTIQRIAYGFYIILVVSFGAIAFGMYRYQREKVENKGKDLLSIIASCHMEFKISKNIYCDIYRIRGIFFTGFWNTSVSTRS